MTTTTAKTERAAQLRTAGLCVALILAVGWLIYGATLGMHAWTFEDRRKLLLPSGAYKAPDVAMLAPSGQSVVHWSAVPRQPAVYLVDFIYTRCPTVCRTLGTEYQRMQRQLVTKPAPAVHLLSVSIDPEHDRPAQLAQYASSLHADPSSWSFAVPATLDDSAALLRGLGVVVVPDGQGGFVHNGAIHMLDEEGRLLALFELDQWEDALATARRVAAARRRATS